MYSFFFRFFRIIKYKISKNYSTFSVFNFLTTKSIFIDIGGNLGSVSQYVQDVCKPRVIEIYEPHSLLYSSLKV